MLSWEENGEGDQAVTEATTAGTDLRVRLKAEREEGTVAAI